jgi:hypothetical protein
MMKTDEVTEQDCMSDLLQALKGVFGGRESHSPVVPGDGTGAARGQRATSVQSGAVRAAMLGINDGLVTNISLILGMVGAGVSVDRLYGFGHIILQNSEKRSLSLIGQSSDVKIPPT